MIIAVNTRFNNIHEAAKFPSIYQLCVNADLPRKIKVHGKFKSTDRKEFEIFYNICV